MTTLATLEYAPVELARPSISEELSKLKLQRRSKHTAALIKALESADVSAGELLSLLQDPATAQLPTERQGVAWSIYADTLYQAGQHEEALDALERAIQLRPDFPEAHYNRGMALKQLGRYQEALEALERAIQLRPDFSEAHYYRGAALGRLGRHQEALEAFEHVYPLRRELSDLGSNLYLGAAFVSLLFGLSALERRWLPDLEAATKAFIKWRARARRDKQTAAFNQAVKQFKEALPEEDKDTFEEFMLGVRLASIRDPFRRWEALGKEISKDWPKDVSAVQAIREQRRW